MLGRKPAMSPRSGRFDYSPAMYGSNGFKSGGEFILNMRCYDLKGVSAHASPFRVKDKYARLNETRIFSKTRPRDAFSISMVEKHQRF
jgi:hypothetical protein